VTRTRVARGLAALDIAMFLAASFVDPDVDYGATALYVVGIASFVVVGALLIDRVPTNPIGVLLLAAGTASAASAVVGVYANLGALQVPSWPATDLARRAGDASFIYPIAIALIGVPLVYPDGHLPSRSFRWVVAIAIGNQVAWTLGGVFDVSGALLELFVLVSTLVAFGGAAIAIIVRFRRGDLVQRQQIKWLAAVVCLASVIIPSGFLLNEVAPDVSNLLVNVGIVALFALPIVIGIAILRYRLYEIDRIISRTIAYVVITTALLAAYAGLVVVIGGPLGNVAGGDTISVALSTLAVAVLFQPLRRRVQRVVDRRFNRARYDAERIASSFSSRLRDEVDIGAVTTDLRQTANATVKPVSLGVWLREVERR